MGIYYPTGTRNRVAERLAQMSKNQLWDLIVLLEIPMTGPTIPDDYDWEHDSIRQRICDFLYEEKFQ